MNTWIQITVVMAIAATQIVSLARAEDPQRQEAAAVVPQGVLPFQSQLHGVVKPVHQAILRSPTAGIVRQIPVKEGQVVQQGQPLLSLDDAISKAAVATAKADANRDAQIRIAEIGLLQAKEKLDRIRTAVKQNAASRFELEEKTSEYEMALANRDLQLELQALAAARLAEANASHESLVLKAPFTGQVIKIHPHLGDSIDSTRPAVTIVQLDQLEVELHLPVDLFRKVFVDHRYVLQAFAPVNRPLDSKAQFVSPIIEPTSGTFRCVFRLDNSDYSLPAGFQVRFVGENKEEHVTQTNSNQQRTPIVSND